jgi:hypothetical protein
MPRSQVAAVDTFDFGAPLTEDTVLEFKVRHGGKLSFRFEVASEAENDVTVTVQVSADGSSYSDSAADTNLVAIADEVVAAGGTKDFADFLLREDEDKFMRILAVGGSRANVQIRGGSLLDIVNI